MSFKYKNPERGEIIELLGLQIFKYLPAAKKTPNSNCKQCGFPTCMAFALKCAKFQADLSLCPFVPNELKSNFEQSAKKPQKTVKILSAKIGGENVLYRHDKTFVNPTAIAVLVDVKDKEKIELIRKFSLKRINDVFKIDFIILKNAEKGTDDAITEKEFLSLPLEKIEEPSFEKTLEKLIFTRKKAVLEKDENFSKPTWVFLKHTEDLFDLCARASAYICKYANLLVFEDFDEALMTTLMTLRQNIFTDPQKPMQVESKLYEFNGGGQDATVLMTTNFALTYFAVANELETIKRPTYLLVTPSEGMSVLTAWSAEKFTAAIVAKAIEKEKLREKVKTRKIILPGLLAHMKKELEEEVPDFEFVVGTNEAYLLAEFVNKLNRKS